MKKSLFEKSYLIKKINYFVSWLYVLVIYGFIGKLFTSHSKLEEKFENSKILGALKGIKLASRVKTKVKYGVAKSLEDSFIINLINRFTNALLASKIKQIGAFVSFVGISGFVAVVIRLGSVDALLGQEGSLIVLLATVAIGAVSLSSRKIFAETLGESKVLGFILLEVFGISKDRFNKKANGFGGYVAPALCGIFVGALCYWFRPIYYVILFLILVLVSLIMVFPEVGILFMFASIPLVNFLHAPSVCVAFLVLVTGISYLIKLAGGKRIFKLRLLDFFVLLFASFMLLSGVIGASDINGVFEALLYCSVIFAYFLTVNLIRSSDWVKRCIFSFVFSGVLSALIGILQIFIGGFEGGWLDQTAFSYISVRITSTFDNPNVFASYLVLLIPYVFNEFMFSEKLGEKIAKFGIFIMLAVCMIETWSRGAWISLAVALVAYLLMYSKKTVPYVALGGIALAAGIPFIAPNVYDRLLSVGNRADTSIGYRVSIWKSVLRMISENWLTGIGYGQAAFQSLYLPFAYSGALAAKHAHSLYLQILVEMGAVGLVLFILVILLFVQNVFEYLYRIGDANKKGRVIAGISAILGILVMGFADHIWYNSRTFLAFWLVISVTASQTRIGLGEREKTAEYTKNTMYSAVLEIETNNM